MRIAVNTENYEILNSIIRTAKNHGNTVIITKLEKQLFNYIESMNVDLKEIDAFVLTNNTSYVQKAIDFIKRYNPYTPIIIIGKSGKYNITSSDVIVPFEKGIDTDFYAKSILHNIYSYAKNFETLRKLSTKMKDIIEFGNCTYDPTKRLLFYKNVEVHKLSPKQSGVFELLAVNFGQVVQKNLILEKVWHQSNYFVGRSLDVFVTHLRKILKNENIKMTITNVSNIGLMLDYLVKNKKK
jgi:DNA-binding winged helix-turn-helix (wHTH) protein